MKFLALKKNSRGNYETISDVYIDKYGRPYTLVTKEFGLGNDYYDEDSYTRLEEDNSIEIFESTGIVAPDDREVYLGSIVLIGYLHGRTYIGVVTTTYIDDVKTFVYELEDGTTIPVTRTRKSRARVRDIWGGGWHEVGTSYKYESVKDSITCAPFTINVIGHIKLHPNLVEESIPAIDYYNDHGSTIQITWGSPIVRG